MQFRNSSEQISAVRYSSVKLRAVQFIDDAGVSFVGNQSAGQGRDVVGTVCFSVFCVQFYVCNVQRTVCFVQSSVLSVQCVL